VSESARPPGGAADKRTEQNGVPVTGGPDPLGSTEGTVAPPPIEVEIVPETSERVATMELIISSVLRYGVLISFVIVLIGAILLFAEGGSEVTVRLSGNPQPNNPGAVIAGALQLQPKAIIDLGLMLLIATPVIRVAASIIAFLFEEDMLYVLITTFVLAMLLLSFFLGQAGG
jgi:uncharacterized membrane protein